MTSIKGMVPSRIGSRIRIVLVRKRGSQETQHRCPVENPPEGLPRADRRVDDRAEGARVRLERVVAQVGLRPVRDEDAVAARPVASGYRARADDGVLLDHAYRVIVAKDPDALRVA